MEKVEYFLLYESLVQPESKMPIRSLNNVMQEVEKVDRKEKLQEKQQQQKRKQKVRDGDLILQLILKNRAGAVLVICMIFICIFASLAVSLCSMTGTKLQIAQNQKMSYRAFAAAESGLQAAKYWMINDANGFAGKNHVLDTQSQQSFIVEINETSDPNTLAVKIIGACGEFEKRIGGQFQFADPNDPNEVWKFIPTSYWEGN